MGVGELERTGAARANMAFTGIASFCKLPIAGYLDSVEADAVVIGVPYDWGVGFRPGARFGPRAIREMSTRYAFGEAGSAERGYFDVETGLRMLEDVAIVDGGDVDVVYLDVEHSFREIARAVESIARTGAVPVVLGGDHSISFPVAKGLECRGPFGVLHLDAHLDFKDRVLGVTVGNSSPMRRISELPYVTAMATVGIRGIRTSEADLRAALARGNAVVGASEVLEKGVEFAASNVPDCPRYYVSVDIDVLDPSVAPGTGSPEPDGLSYKHVLGLIRRVAERSEIVGFDLVEVNPYLDPTQRTPLVAARLVVEVLGAIFGGRTGALRRRL